MIEQVVRAPARSRPVRPAWAVAGERALELLIKVCGISAIIFVLGTFFFVAREAVPILASPEFAAELKCSRRHDCSAPSGGVERS